MTETYLIASIMLIIALGSILLPMNDVTPLKWQYYHYFLRKPVNGVLFLTLVITCTLQFIHSGTLIAAFAPFALGLVALVLTYKMHQESIFKAVYNPKTTTQLNSLPISNDQQIAIIEINGITKCYPLNFVAKHHIINDQFGKTNIALTYCPMCKSIIPFDTSIIGELFVSTYKNGNMILADKKTKTFFQQSSFQSVIGKLHPMELTMLPFQMLTWHEVKKMSPTPEVCIVSEKDLTDFELPVPGLWKILLNSEFVPGLSKKKIDKSLPARTEIIGIRSNTQGHTFAYIKGEVLEKQLVINAEKNILLIGHNKTVNGFKIPSSLLNSNWSLQGDKVIDLNTNRTWDLRGKAIDPSKAQDLEPLLIADEYWFSWKKNHPNSQLLTI